MRSTNENGAGQEGHAPRAVCWDRISQGYASSSHAAEACKALGLPTQDLHRAWTYCGREGDVAAVRFRYMNRGATWKRCAFMHHGVWSTTPRMVPLFGLECLEPGKASLCIGAPWESEEAWWVRKEAMQGRDWVPTIDAEDTCAWLRWKGANAVACLQAPDVSDGLTDWTPLAGRPIQFIPHRSHEARAAMDRVWSLLEGLGCTLWKGGRA